MTPMLLLPATSVPSVTSVIEPPARELLRVLIAFDDTAAYQRAMRLLVRVLSHEDDGLDVRPMPWRFDALELPDWQSLAALDAAHASIIIVSTSCPLAPTAAVRAWAHACCVVERTSSALLVALLGAPGEAAEMHASFHQYLRELAAQSGLAFLAPQPPDAGEIAPASLAAGALALA